MIVNIFITLLRMCFLSLCRPYVILQVGAAVLLVVLLLYILITWRNPPKDLLFFGIVRPLIIPFITTIPYYTFQSPL